MQILKGLLPKGEAFQTRFSSLVHKYGPVQTPRQWIHIVVPLFQEPSWVSIVVEEEKAIRKAARLELGVQDGLIIEQGVAIWPETKEILYDSYRLRVEIPEIQ
jgi:hypothetical protein